MKHARSDYDAIQDPRGLIPEDEPVMLIRGQDNAALPAAMAWMKAARHAGASSEILALVGEHVGRIARWQADHGSKTADLPGEGVVVARMGE